VDFLNLVQRKEHKTDNKIIIATVFLVVLIMSSIVFWPTSSKYNLLTYLPDDTSFYYHFTNKDTFSDNFLNQEMPSEKILELEGVLGGNFLNLQEIIWFQVDGNQDDNYLLRFSRLPKDILEDFATETSFRFASPQKNMLLISSGQELGLLEVDLDKNIYFEKGISVYWQKNKSPEFLEEISTAVEPVFAGDDVLLNWQKLTKGKNKISLLENKTSELKDLKDFLMPEDFDLVFGFRNGINNLVPQNFSINMLKSLFDSLPYYNLNNEVIKNRILQDTIVWQKDDAWILASNTLWQEDILNFIDSFEVKEVPGVLSDGTAYIELVANSDQSTIEHQINGQKVLQIDELFIWDIGEQHYLSNSKKAIEDLTTHNNYLSGLLEDCSADLDSKIGDFMYFETKDIVEGKIKDYLVNNKINSLKMSSYATGSISGLNICF
jgi:hypothetical protein